MYYEIRNVGVMVRHRSRIRIADKNTLPFDYFTIAVCADDPDGIVAVVLRKR